MTLVMMALFFLTSEKVRCCDELPLLSAYDIREIMITVYPKKAVTHQDVMEQIRIRHAQRFGKPKSYVKT